LETAQAQRELRDDFRRVRGHSCARPLALSKADMLEGPLVANSASLHLEGRTTQSAAVLMVDLGR
jgi:hypothetical protein